MQNAIAIITGDIVNSRLDKTNLWLNNLKDVLKKIGKEEQEWEIYRGDSFQLQTEISTALIHALTIKAFIKQNKLTDVRMAIGIGSKTNNTSKITQANGSAFINSGDCFNQLKKERIAIKTANKEFDHTLNLMLKLASLTINHWTPATSYIIGQSLTHCLNQKELANKLNKSQSTVSEALNRGGFDSIMDLNQYYQNQVQKL